MEEFESYIAFRFGKDSLGKDALDYLIRDVVLTKEIERRGIVISPEDLQKAIATMETQLKLQTNHTLDEELASKGMDRATFESIYKKQIACERMVRADLALSAADALRPEQQELWLQEKVKNANVKKDGLKAGTAAMIDSASIYTKDVGHTIRLKLSKTDARDAIRACLGIRIIEEAAKAAGIVTTKDDLNAAIERRRERFAKNPLVAGVSFEQFLNARGFTIDDLLADSALRAEALLWKLALQQFPDEEVDKRYQSNKDHFDGLYGEQRKLSWILIIAGEFKNALIPKSYEEADKELKDMLPLLTSAEEFGRKASIYSRHEDSRKRNGEIGWLNRRDANFDARLLAFAFAKDTPVGKAAGPIHTDQGSALVFVHAIKPAPEPAVMRRHVRTELTAELYRKLGEDAKVATYLDSKIPGADTKDKNPKKQN